ncbi:STAS domain-containing protein [Mycobacterium sp.]|uniref:STAS domain-containing protein n=1 Tax=Mycobacterium sp. TaxID=1785 RepID=UPI003F9E802D
MTRAVFQLQNPDNGAAATTTAEVTVTGEIDVTNVDEFTRSVLDVPGPRPIILELSGVKYLDSAGFAALDRLLEQNAIVLVLSPDSFMYRVAELMCLPIHHDSESARRALREKEAGGLEPDLWP